MSFRISSIFEYSIWLLKKYSEYYKSAENNFYRIIEIKQLNTGDHKITAQVIGKASIFECTPAEAVANDSIIEGFSKKDIRTITFLAYHKNLKPKIRILEQDFSDSQQQMLFKIVNTCNGELAVKTANQIMIDRALINCLSKEDLKIISYMAGYECAQKSID